jgi:hypothetical protein
MTAMMGVLRPVTIAGGLVLLAVGFGLRMAFRGARRDLPGRFGRLRDRERSRFRPWCLFPARVGTNARLGGKNPCAN